MPKKGEKHLTIKFDELENYVRCIVEDNGIGISSNTDKEIPSRGTTVTSQRIDSLKQFADEELLQIESSAEGTKVTIRIPKEN